MSDFDVSWYGFLANVPVWAIAGVLARILYARINNAITDLTRSVKLVSDSVLSFSVSIAEIKKDISFIDKNHANVEEMIALTRSNKNSLDALHSKIRVMEEENKAILQIKESLYEDIKLIKHRQHWFANKLTILKYHAEKEGTKLGETQNWDLPSKNDL